VSGQRLLAASGQILMAAHRPFRRFTIDPHHYPLGGRPAASPRAVRTESVHSRRPGVAEQPVRPSSFTAVRVNPPPSVSSASGSHSAGGPGAPGSVTAASLV
jgi:hypothetical protein